MPRRGSTFPPTPRPDSKRSSHLLAPFEGAVPRPRLLPVPGGQSDLGVTETVSGVKPLQPPAPQSMGKSEPQTAPIMSPLGGLLGGGCVFLDTQILSALAQTHSLKLLIGEKTGLTAGCEVTENAEGVAGAALVGVNPVFAWEGQTDG